MNKVLMFALMLILSLTMVYADQSCNLDSETADCSIENGKLTLGQLETNAFIAAEQGDVCIVYFYSDTCSHCKAIKPFLDNLKMQYEEDIHLTAYEVSTPENLKLYNQICQKTGYEGKSIPLIGINDIVLVGEKEIRDNLENEIIRGIESDDKVCPLGGDMACHLDAESTPRNDTDGDSLIEGMKDTRFGSVLPVIIFAGLGDGINPCAFMILIFVMVFLQQISGSKKKLLKISFTYAFTIFATNILLGILYFILSIQLGFPSFIRWAVIIISFIAGIINIKDFFWYGKGISLGIPKPAKKYLKQLINKASVPSAFVLGASVAILEAPCSVPIYLAVIEILKGEGNSLMSVMPHILIYNIMFILPLIAIALVVYFTQKAKVIEEQSLVAKKWMKLGMGIILLLLGLALLMGWL